MPFGREIGFSPSDIVLNWDAGAPSPIFGPCLLGQMTGWIKMPLGREVGLSPSDIMLDGDPAPLPKRGHSSQFLAHVYCGLL